MECTYAMNFRKVSLRTLSVLLLAAMLMTAVPASALAGSYSAYVKAKETEVYKDEDMEKFYGTLASKTVVTVKDVDDGVAKIKYNGKTGYCDADDLGKVSSIAKEAEANCKTKVYEEADTDSRSSTLKKGTEVNVLAVKGSWAMVEKDGNVGYVKADDLDIEGESSSKEDQEDLPDDEAFEEAVKEQVKEEKPEKKMSVKEIFASGKYTNEQLCYAFAIKELGYNNAAAAGLLANIKAESNFRTNANGDSGQINVIYKRKDGHFGLIEPE